MVDPPITALGIGRPVRVAVFRALQLGDMLCAVPALRALRHGLPTAEITLIGLPWAVEFAWRFGHLVDRFVPFPGYPGLPEQPADPLAIPSFIAAMQREQFDLVIQAHGSGGITNPLVTRFRARRIAGFFDPGSPCPDHETFLPWQSKHEIHQLLDLVTHLGMPNSGDSLEFPLSDKDIARFEALAQDHGIFGKPYICVHPGSQLPSRRWPVARFAAVAQALSDLQYEIVLTGTASEKPLIEAVASRMSPPPKSLAGQTSLGELGVLIRHAALLLSNDTGVGHIAAALRTPSIVVACGSDVSRWRPLDTALHRVLSVDVPCRPCAYSDCPIGHPCALGISEDDVVTAAIKHVALTARQSDTIPNAQ